MILALSKIFGNYEMKINKEIFKKIINVDRIIEKIESNSRADW